jgi:hypothetical protein
MTTHNKFFFLMLPSSYGRDHRGEVAARVLAYSGVILWFTFIALFEYFSYTRPVTRDPVHGRIYEQNNHGRYTYLTAREHEALVGLPIAAFALFISGSLVDPEKRIWRWRPPRAS